MLKNVVGKINISWDKKKEVIPQKYNHFIRNSLCAELIKCKRLRFAMSIVSYIHDKDFEW